MALTAKQARFAQEYIVDCNATKAATRAGYSAKTAHVIGSENLTKPEIAREVERLRAALSKRVEMDADWVLRRLRAVAKQTDLTAATKIRALELIGKHLGMFTEKIDLTVKLSPEEIRAKLATLLREAKEGT